MPLGWPTSTELTTTLWWRSLLVSHSEVSRIVSALLSPGVGTLHGEAETLKNTV